MLTLYLAGAIRDTHREDVEWREQLIFALNNLNQDYDDPIVQVLNPLGNKTFNPNNKEWRVGGVLSTPSLIFQQDLWCVRRADIIVAHLGALSDRYPNIGTLMEIGAAVGMGGKLIYTIISPTYQGHDNPGVFRLHPFLAEASSATFGTYEECEEFLVSHLPTLAGVEPNFGGVREV